MIKAWAAMGIIGCASAAPAYKTTPHDQRFQREPPPALHAYPGEDGPHIEMWDKVLHLGVRPLARVLSPGTYVDPPPALDVNHFGQVVDSTWFTNRMGRVVLDPEAVQRGVEEEGPPAPGPLVVLSGKLSGATPGLVVRDTEGDIFIVKLDPPAYPELASGAEVVASRILWAAGYNVPENYLLSLDVSRLIIGEDSVRIGEYDAIVPMDEDYLSGLITNANPDPEGIVRALFSRRVPGKIVGPFSYRGTRWSDPNDTIAHEHRRSLRGLWVFSAWLNNTDVAMGNTLDTFINIPEHPNLGHLVHYLIDFGDSLGAAGVDPKYVGQGYQHLVDWEAVGKALFSLGMYYSFWLPIQRSPFRSVGVFESQVFMPGRWKADVPNPAFQMAHPLDTYWAASIIARFTPRHIGAAVNAARYTEPGAGAWIRQVLSERRLKILEYAFASVLPLDDPELEEGWVLHLRDLAVESGLASQPPPAYHFQVIWDRTDLPPEDLGWGSSQVPAYDLGEVVQPLRERAGKALEADPFIAVRWWIEEGGPSVWVRLRVLQERLLLVGLDRDWK